MKIRIPLSVLLFFFYTEEIRSQVQYSGWLASFNTVKLNKNFSAHLDVQLRSTDNIKQVQALLVRPGINYHITKTLTATAGYALIPARKNFNNDVLYAAEHRIWQQLLFVQKAANFSLTHRLRFEQRFIPQLKEEATEIKVDGYNYAYRLRYFARSIIPFNQQQKFSKGYFAAVQNEVFFNTGNTTAVNGKFFDQNRAYAAVGYRFNM